MKTYLFLIYALFNLGITYGTQDDPYEKYRMIDDISGLKYANSLVVYDLNIKDGPNDDLVYVTWDAHKNLRYFYVEMYDKESLELIYRQKHYQREALFPKSGYFTVYPVVNNQRGKGLSIDYEEAARRNFKPKNTPKRVAALEQAAANKKAQQEYDLEQEQLRIKEEAREDIDWIWMIRIGAFSLVVVGAVIAINTYRNSNKKPRRNKEYDRNFENRK